jgi:hypothetical protein
MRAGRMPGPSWWRLALPPLALLAFAACCCLHGLPLAAIGSGWEPFITQADEVSTLAATQE